MGVEKSEVEWWLSVQNTGRLDCFLPDSSPGPGDLFLGRPEKALALGVVERAGGRVVNLSHPVFPLRNVCDLTPRSQPLGPLSLPAGQGGSRPVQFRSLAGIPLGLLVNPTGSEDKTQEDGFQVCTLRFCPG